MAFDQKGIVESEQELLQQLKEAEKKAEENCELLLRTKAEMENLRKRTEKDLEKAHKYGMEKFVNEMLPVKDSMELGIAAQDATVDSLHEGMTLTMSMLNTALQKLGVEEIDPATTTVPAVSTTVPTAPTVTPTTAPTETASPPTTSSSTAAPSTTAAPTTTATPSTSTITTSTTTTTTTSTTAAPTTSTTTTTLAPTTTCKGNNGQGGGGGSCK